MLFFFVLHHNWACQEWMKLFFFWSADVNMPHRPSPQKPAPASGQSLFVTRLPASVNIMFVVCDVSFFSVQARRCRSQLVWLSRRSRERLESFDSTMCWSTMEDTMTLIQVTVTPVSLAQTMMHKPSHFTPQFVIENVCLHCCELIYCWLFCQLIGSFV